MSFYMNMGARILNEGDQAEAYKDKKREERRTQFQQSKRERDMVPYSDNGRDKNWVANTGKDISNYNPDEKRFVSKAEKNGIDKESAKKHEEKMMQNSRKGSEIAHREAKRRDEAAKKNGKSYDEEFDDNFKSAVDAANRHIRRHPNAYKECGIFSECYFVNE